VNKPETKITLALKPKVLDPNGGTTKKIHTPGAPEILPPGIDRAVLDELRQAVRTYDYLRQFGEPIEFWEAVRLARARRGISEAAPEEPGPAEEGLAEELQALRRQLSPMVRDLRRFLQHVPDLPPPGEKLEIALGFLLASSRNHEAVAKWLADSDKHLEKAASKLRGLADIASPYLEVLRPWSLDGEQATFTMDKEAAPAPAVPAAPVTIDPDALENLRRAVWCRRLFAEEQLEASFWEVLMLNTAERVPTQARQAQIYQHKKDNELAAFHEETRNLHSRIMPIRARHGRWVEVFQSWLRDVPGVPKDPGEFELAVAFAVVESDGPARARKWLETPEASSREAAHHLAKLAVVAKAYVAALKKPAS
jgi:hypothetical protein